MWGRGLWVAVWGAAEERGWDLQIKCASAKTAPQPSHACKYPQTLTHSYDWESALKCSYPKFSSCGGQQREGGGTFCSHISLWDAKIQAFDWPGSSVVWPFCFLAPHSSALATVWYRCRRGREEGPAGQDWVSSWGEAVIRSGERHCLLPNLHPSESFLLPCNQPLNNAKSCI